jgi:hypothetical protein
MDVSEPVGTVTMDVPKPVSKRGGKKGDVTVRKDGGKKGGETVRKDGSKKGGETVRTDGSKKGVEILFGKVVITLVDVVFDKVPDRVVSIDERRVTEYIPIIGGAVLREMDTRVAIANEIVFPLLCFYDDDREYCKYNAINQDLQALYCCLSSGDRLTLEEERKLVKQIGDQVTSNADSFDAKFREEVHALKIFYSNSTIDF